MVLIKKPFRKCFKQAHNEFTYSLCFGFCPEEMLFPERFFMGVNAKFAGELLGKFPLSLTVLSFETARLLCSFIFSRRSVCIKKKLITLWITGKVNASLSVVMNSFFCEKKKAFYTNGFFIGVNANFAGESLAKFHLSYSLKFWNDSASLLIHFPPVSLHRKGNKEVSGLQTKLMPR